MIEDKTRVKYRRPLNSEQLEVLKLLYKFRFGTARYIAQYLGKGNLKVVQKKLKILEDQTFIAKRYDSSYKLQGKPAEYYLIPKGARLLADKVNDQVKLVDQVTDQGIKNLYKNKDLSEDYVAHCLSILKAALHLQELYGNKLQCFTRMQMIPFDYLPTWRPDLFLSLKPGTKSKAKPKRFFLDIWDGTRPFFVSVRKARSYITYIEEGDWPTDEADIPTFLMLCDSERNETKLRRQIRKALEESDEEVWFGTTSLNGFMAMTTAKNNLWCNVTDDDKQYALL